MSAVRHAIPRRAIISKFGRQVLEQGVGAQVLQGALQALTAAELKDSDVMGLIRDLLVMTPPLQGVFEVLSTFNLPLRPVLACHFSESQHYLIRLLPSLHA